MALADIRGKIFKRVRKDVSTDPGTTRCRIMEAVRELESMAGIETVLSIVGSYFERTTQVSANYTIS